MYFSRVSKVSAIAFRATVYIHLIQFDQPASVEFIIYLQTLFTTSLLIPAFLSTSPVITSVFNLSIISPLPSNTSKSMSLFISCIKYINLCCMHSITISCLFNLLLDCMQSFIIQPTMSFAYCYGTCAQ
eukprot:NODE_261_length_12589_cov_0.423139.p7 type:complete len:129 gc:universal NODE_261_length_12589_cov_0.423139:3534-3148(-)